MKVKIKKLHPDAVLPFYAKPGDAGMDLTSVSITEGMDDIVEYGTGLAIEIPSGYVGLIFPRSSIYKQDLSLSNSVGVIDSGYRGEIRLKFRMLTPNENQYQNGDRVGQLIILPYPQIEFEEGELSETERADGGFGSTNK